MDTHFPQYCHELGECFEYVRGVLVTRVPDPIVSCVRVQSEEVYAIQEGDPLSATATCSRDVRMRQPLPHLCVTTAGPPPMQWCHINASSTMTATQSDFVVVSQLVVKVKPVLDDGKQWQTVFGRQWREAFPRHCV